jgi:2-oxoglutarate dehydrogenase E2 component (dihydrolipoamide succinyltransferase)
VSVIDAAAGATAPPPAPAPAGAAVSGRAPLETTRPVPAQVEPSGPPPARPAATPPGGWAPAEALRQRSSPLVRKLAREHNLDISQISGTGLAGRVSKQDVLDYLERGGTAARVETPERVEKMSVMRRKIAEHMVLSRRTSAHVHSVFEVDFSRVARVRAARRDEFERAGARLTYLAFIARAAVDALRAVPIVNASIDGDSIVYHGDINIGIAVALDWGLIVPVIRRAGGQNLLGLSRAIADLATRARSKQLKPEEAAGGTFTITNPGVFGALFGMPIINQPQVAILGVGAIEKRPVVVDDAIAIRPMAYLSLGYDHRVIDGAVADQFMSHVKRGLETWDEGRA